VDDLIVALNDRVDIVIEHRFQILEVIAEVSGVLIHQIHDLLLLAKQLRRAGIIYGKLWIITDKLEALFQAGQTFSELIDLLNNIRLLDRIAGLVG